MIPFSWRIATGQLHHLIPTYVYIYIHVLYIYIHIHIYKYILTRIIISVSFYIYIYIIQTGVLILYDVRYWKIWNIISKVNIWTCLAKCYELGPPPFLLEPGVETLVERMWEARCCAAAPDISLGKHRGLIKIRGWLVEVITKKDINGRHR